jgi:hypothetical protein
MRKIDGLQVIIFSGLVVGWGILIAAIALAVTR